MPVPSRQRAIFQKVDWEFIHVWLVMGGGTTCRAARDVKSGRISTWVTGLMTGNEVSCASEAPLPPLSADTCAFTGTEPMFAAVQPILNYSGHILLCERYE